MAAADTSVKNYRSTDPGAPVLSGLTGSLIAVLDACQTNGYNLLTATSVVVANGIATVTYATAHGGRAGAVWLFAGATPAALNGEKRIISVTTNSLTFDATGVADGVATGTITSKMAPAGFAKVFAGANKAVYRSADVLGSSRCYLRIDDSVTAAARVLSYESMTDIDTGSGFMPTSAQIAGGAYWPKSSTADSTARAWRIYSDGRFIYFWVDLGSIQKLYCWGEYPSYCPGDSYNTILGASPTAYPNSFGRVLEVVAGVDSATSYTATYFGCLTQQRAADQLGASKMSAPHSLLQCGSASVTSGCADATYGVPAYPSEVTGGFDLCDVFIRSTTSKLNCAKRGKFPGLFHFLQQMGGFSLTTQQGIPSLPNAAIDVLPSWTDGALGNAYLGIDVVGPWR